jgi:hypothetical protein
MHQRELLPNTKRYFQLSDQKESAVRLYESYSDYIISGSFLLALSAGLIWAVGGELFVGIFGVVLLLFALVIEFLFQYITKLSGKELVRYYSLQMYQNPSEENLKRLQQWNTNPFEFRTEYYYPRLASLIHTAQSKDQDTVEYISQHIADELRLIEQQESSTFNELFDKSELDTFNLSEYEKRLFSEANYCYKFGAYTSTSVLLRKITEQLLVDILIQKGYYSELRTEWSYEEIVSVFIENIDLPETQRIKLEETLNQWVKKKGNKAAHKNEAFTQKEVLTLVERSKDALNILLVIREEPELDEE